MCKHKKELDSFLTVTEKKTNMSDSDIDDDGDFMIFPITDIDNNLFHLNKNNVNENDADDEQEENVNRKSRVNIGIKQRRRSQSSLLIPLQIKLNLNAQFNNATKSNDNEFSEESNGDLNRVSKTSTATESLLHRRNNKLSTIAASPTSGFAKESNLNLRLGRKRWKLAMKKIKELKDPWEKFHIEEFEAETAVRHRYNALEKEWLQDEIVLKIEKKVF